jgi:hypothetical protein
MGTRFNFFVLLGFLALVSSGCDLGPVGTPPPLTKAQARGVLSCQHTIKVASALFYNTKITKLGDCADKILALQVSLENGLITQSQFDKSIETVAKDCEKGFTAIGRTSTAMVDAIFGSCTPVEDLIISAYDPLQFVALGESNPINLGSIESVDDIVRYACLGGELWMDLAVWFNVPRVGRLLDSVGLAEFIDSDPDGLIPAVPLDPRCSGTT